MNNNNSTNDREYPLMSIKKYTIMTQLFFKYSMLDKNIIIENINNVMSKLQSKKSILEDLEGLNQENTIQEISVSSLFDASYIDPIISNLSNCQFIESLILPKCNSDQFEKLCDILCDNTNVLYLRIGIQSGTNVYKSFNKLLLNNKSINNIVIYKYFGVDENLLQTIINSQYDRVISFPNHTITIKISIDTLLTFVHTFQNTQMVFNGVKFVDPNGLKFGDDVINDLITKYTYDIFMYKLMYDIVDSYYNLLHKQHINRYINNGYVYNKLLSSRSIYK